MARTFPSLSAVPENADVFSSEEFSPSCSDSMPFSVQVDTSDMINPATGNYTVMGSNISDDEADMVPVKDENGASGSFGLAQPFVAERFPFKYIGIKYAANGNVGAGNLSFYYEQKANRVNIA